MKSRENWIAVNKFGGKALLICSIFLCVAGVPIAVLLRHSPAGLDYMVAAPLVYVVPLVLIHRFEANLP